MKKIVAQYSLMIAMTFSGCMMIHFGFAQEKQKKPPTPQEVEQMKKKMQAELDKISPEQRRQMAERGIDVPDLKGLDQIQAIANANPNARRSEMPARDAARIASIPATPSVNTLGSYIKNVHQSAAEKLGKDVAARTEKLYASMQAEGTSIREMGHVASGLWAAGQYQEALYLAGKLCSADQEDPDNLSNYAAFLTMAGAEPMAIPLLRMLNKVYPNNSTILNNLGQAWFGLGDLAMSTRYLDSAIRFFPGHAQAHFTKSQIEESKGNKEAAVEAMKKSLENGFSTEKETRLRKLGYPVDKGDVSWPLDIPQDPLGLHKFVLPSFPHDVFESEGLMGTWDDFKKRIRKEQESLKTKKRRLDIENNEYHARQMDRALQSRKLGAPEHAQGPLSLRAQQKLTYLMNDKDGGLSYQWKRAEENYLSKGKKLREVYATKNEKSKQIEEKFESLFGEGKSKYTMKDYCREVDQMNSDYLGAANTIEEQSINEYLDMLRKWINTQAYFQQYYYPDPVFEVAKVDYQLLWLGVLDGMRPQFISPHPECHEKKTEFKESTLQEFDDVACQYHSKMDFKYFSIESNCSRMTTKFKGGPVDFEMTENVEKNEIIRGSLEVSAGKSVSVEKGPVKAEGSATATGRLEFDNRGITDVVIIVKAEVEVGIESLTEGPVSFPATGGRSITIGGVEGRMGWNSGSSVTGKGILQGVKIK